MRIAERKLGVDLVAVAASVAVVAAPRQIARLLKVAHDLRRRTFADPYGEGNVSEPCPRVGGNPGKHVSMVGKKLPEMIRFTGT
jgi:hypothetical protein